MTKKIKNEISRRKKSGALERARADSMSSPDLSPLLDALDRFDAADAGLTIEQWQALPEIEQIRRWEDFEDRKLAGPATLEAYREQKRRLFEAGEFRPECGQPMWLRSEYAREDPRKVANELAQLVFHGMSATGEILKQTIAAMECRTRRGWLGTGLGFAELKLRVEEEIDRLGLREQFNEALAEASDFERTIQ